MPLPATVGRLAELAEDQWGLITRRQAEDAGIPKATFQRLAGEGSILERVAHGVYRLAGAPIPTHLALRAAWIQLCPETPAWERTLNQGVVSHRSAAALYGVGHLPADTHEFTLPTRRQTRRPDVRLHHLRLDETECTHLQGLPVTRPSRIAFDLLSDQEDPEAVGNVAADAIRSARDYPGAFAHALSTHAARFGLRRGDGLGLLRWLLSLVGDPRSAQWVEEAHLDLAADRSGSGALPERHR
jgi:predicted transcriptional regulator of viral defense system